MDWTIINSYANERGFGKFNLNIWVKFEKVPNLNKIIELSITTLDIKKSVINDYKRIDWTGDGE